MLSVWFIFNCRFIDLTVTVLVSIRDQRCHLLFPTTLTRGRATERSHWNRADLPTGVYCLSPFSCSRTEWAEVKLLLRHQHRPLGHVNTAWMWGQSNGICSFNGELLKCHQALFFDCVLSKYSWLLSVLHFKPFHPAALWSIFASVSAEGPACGF